MWNGKENLFQKTRSRKQCKVFISSSFDQKDYRRPYGCGVLSLKELPADGSISDLSMSIYTIKDEALFPSLHEGKALFSSISSKAIIAKSPAITPRSGDVKLSLRWFKCTWRELLSMDENFESYSLTKKFKFPSEMVHFEETRNDLYLTLEGGEFGQGNFEVVVEVRLDNGERLMECISVGSGAKSLSEYRSVVYYHSSSPRWNETIKINILSNLFERAHIRFDIRHCSSSKTCCLPHVRQSSCCRFFCLFESRSIRWNSNS